MLKYLQGDDKDSSFKQKPQEREYLRLEVFLGGFKVNTTFEQYAERNFSISIPFVREKGRNRVTAV